MLPLLGKRLLRPVLRTPILAIQLPHIVLRLERSQTTNAFMEEAPSFEDSQVIPSTRYSNTPHVPIRNKHMAFRKTLREAQPPPFLPFVAIEEQVRIELEKSVKEQKVRLQMLPRFGGILDALRPNELTIFTGPTGCGKTTVLSQMSLDYAYQGVPILWGSFEIRTARLAQVMLQQIATRPLIDSMGLNWQVFQEASDVLRELPIQFMNLFGSTDLNSVLDVMETNITTASSSSTGHPPLIILDNLQFMLSGQATSTLDKWTLMDQAITSLRSFCNTFPVHIILVVHPRKEMDDTPLGLASVSGTAKATQEADNVIILQKIGEKRYLEVKKNRYWGELGRIRIGFNPNARLVSELEEAIDREKSAQSNLVGEKESIEKRIVNEDGEE